MDGNQSKMLKHSRKAQTHRTRRRESRRQRRRTRGNQRAWQWRAKQKRRRRAGSFQRPRRREIISQSRSRLRPDARTPLNGEVPLRPHLGQVPAVHRRQPPQAPQAARDSLQQVAGVCTRAAQVAAAGQRGRAGAHGEAQHVVMLQMKGASECILELCDRFIGSSRSSRARWCWPISCSTPSAT